MRLLPLFTRPLSVEKRVKYSWDNCETFCKILILLNTNFHCFLYGQLELTQIYSCLLWVCPKHKILYMGLFTDNCFIFILNIILASSFQHNYFASYQRTALEIRVHSLWCMIHGLCWAFDEICLVFLSFPGLLPTSALSSIFPPFTLFSSFRISNIILICSSYMYISKNETLSFPHAWRIIQVNASILHLYIDLYW